MPLYSEGQNLSANQILSTYLNSWLRYNYFRFGNRNVCIYEFCFRFRFRSYHAICMLLNFIQTGPPAAEIWRHIHFSRWRERPLNSTSGFVLNLLMSLPSEGGQNLSANQISSTYLNWRPRYNYFRFWKTNVRHFVILLPVLISDLDHFAVICMLFCISLLNFVHIKALIAEIWRHIYFSRWRPQPLNITSGFVFVDVTAFRWSKSIRKPNFVDISQFTVNI